MLPWGLVWLVLHVGAMVYLKCTADAVLVRCTVLSVYSELTLSPSWRGERESSDVPRVKAGPGNDTPRRSPWWWNDRVAPPPLEVKASRWSSALKLSQRTGATWRASRTHAARGVARHEYRRVAARSRGCTCRDDIHSYIIMWPCSFENLMFWLQMSFQGCGKRNWKWTWSA